MPTLWSLEVNKAILDQVKVTEYNKMIKHFNFLRNEDYVRKITLRNKDYVRKITFRNRVHYISFTSKFIWNHLYHLQ